MIIFGIGHYSRTGKDTFANYLITWLKDRAPQLRVIKRPFAWKLKQITHELYAWAGLREPEYYDTHEGAKLRDIKLPVLNLTPVEIWVAFGTPAVREQVYDRTWIDYNLKTVAECDVLIIPDVRFPNETKAILETNGTLIKVVRPGYGPKNTVADRALLNYTGWHYVIGHEGSMESLNRWAERFACQIIHGNPVRQTWEERQEALKVEIRNA